jgi:hypothetical protein
VRAQLSLEQGRRSAVALSQPMFDARNDGALVHFSGLLTTDSDVLDSAGNKLAHARSPFVLDPLFGIAVKGVRLYRDVEMLQWEETSHTSTSSTPEDEDRRADDIEERDRVYMYDLRWRSEHIDSTSFNDPSYWNPPLDAWVYESKVVKASSVVVGDFKISDPLIDQIKRRDDVQLDAATRKTMANVLNQRLGDKWEGGSALRNVSIEEDKYFYARQNPQTLAQSVLGDLRVSFSVAPAHPVTVCAQQQQRSLVPFSTPAGESIYLLEDGIHSVSELFEAKLDTKFRENRFSRLFSSVIGFIGFLVMHPLVVTRLGRALQKLPNPVLAASLSCALTFTIAAVCWLPTSVLYSGAILAGGVTPAMLVIAFVRLSRRFKNE